MAARKTSRSAQATIRFVWGDIAQMDTRYANQLQVANAGDEFFVVFGELTPPLMTEGEPPPATHTIRPVIRLIVPPTAMIDFARAINENVKKYKARIGMDDTDAAP